MKPDISEFSYGYAIIDELIHTYHMPLNAAPVLPSLSQEGQPGGGYDAKLATPGVLLFLQFKLSDFIVRGNAREARQGLIIMPYFRMHLRPRRHSRQHEMLLNLEAQGNLVYYCAPIFHTPQELNSAFLNHQVSESSIWLQPRAIGALPDDRDHYIAFNDSRILFCSKPKVLEKSGSLSEFVIGVTSYFKDQNKTALNKDTLNELAQKMLSIAFEFPCGSPKNMILPEKELRQRHPLEIIAICSFFFFQCHLLIISESNINDAPQP